MKLDTFCGRGLALVGALTLFCVGCGGDMGRVSGTITLDGKPLPNAIVTFYPQGGDGGRASAGRTDDQGQYELTYSRSEKGAKVGEHLVTITTAVDGGDYSEESEESIGQELVPTKYNAKSELKEQVVAGSNTINFELDSEGEIVQSAY